MKKEIREISMDELEAVAGGKEVGVLNVIGANLLHEVGSMAMELGANGVAMGCFNASNNLITP